MQRNFDGYPAERWGYDGMVVSDWGAVHDMKKAAESALDLEMSVTYDFDNYCLARPLKEAVEKGEISEGLIDEKVKNILRLMDRLHMLPGEHRQSGSYNTPEHQKTLLKAAEESIVLLKNENHILPLKPERIRKLLVVGDNANPGTFRRRRQRGDQGSLRDHAPSGDQDAAGWQYPGGFLSGLSGG